MRNVERRKLELFERVQAFMQENAKDFPPGSVGAKTALIIGEIIMEMRELAARQISGANTAQQSYTDKNSLMDDLQSMIRNMNRAANAFADEVPDVGEKFRLPRNRSQQTLLATARAYHTDAQGIDAKFIEYGLDENFLEDLDKLIKEIENAKTQSATGGGQRAEATEGLLDAARRGMNAVRKLNSIVLIKYDNNPQKLAAWAVASHLEKAPQRNNGEDSSPAA